MLTTKLLKKSLSEKQVVIRKRLAEFRKVIKRADDGELFEELAFCIFTAGASAKMGVKSIDAVRPALFSASSEKLFAKLLKENGAHRFPNERARYLLHTRNYLLRYLDEDPSHHSREGGNPEGLGKPQKSPIPNGLKSLLLSFSDPNERRDFFATNKDIKGIGFKEASHFLRNIGFSGYAILDKHIMNCLFELKVVDDPKPPVNGKRYLEIEKKLKRYAKRNGFDIDEIDLLLWSEKTGEILK